MGGCISLWCTGNYEEEEYYNNSTAKVIGIDGDLREFPVPMSVSQLLLQLEQQLVIVTEEKKKKKQYMVCNSDRLYYEEYITAMGGEEELQAGHIYFVLPTSKLQYPLTPSDMAALALKATLALQPPPPKTNKKNTKNKKIGRISPMGGDSTAANQNSHSHSQEEEFINSIMNNSNTRNKKSSLSLDNNNNNKSQQQQQQQQRGGFSRSGSVRKLQRYTSRRAMLAVRSFRAKLTTIYEGTSVH